MSILKPSTWTDINRRRWKNFCSNKRGFVSCCLFLVLFFISLGAEFIANDKPLLIHANNQYYTPIFVSYPETTFGGEFETETRYRDPFVRKLIADNNGWMIWPLIPFSYDTINYDLTVPAPAPPSSDNWLGTDDQGRDVLARMIYGFRISILFALTLTFFSTIIGVSAGAVQGFFGGKTDLIMQRVLEIWGGMPMLYLLIIMASLVQPNFWWLLLLMLFFSWMSLVHLVRAEFLRARNLDYVRAAKALGASNMRIMFKHMLPNAMVATLTYLPFVLNHAITTLTALDFLGFGLPPGSPSLGELLNQGKNNLQSPWLGLCAFSILALMLTLLIFIGESARDAFDPRKVYGEKK